MLISTLRFAESVMSFKSHLKMHLLLKSRLYIYCVLQLFTILTLVMSFSPVNKYLKGTVHPKIKRYIFSLYLLLLFFFLFFFFFLPCFGGTGHRDVCLLCNIREQNGTQLVTLKAQTKETFEKLSKLSNVSVQKS